VFKLEEKDTNFELVLKFVERQYTESLLKGDFYFSRNRYFIDLEENQIDKGIGDKREGVWSQVLNPQNEEMYIITEDGEEHRINFERGVFRQTFDDLKDYPICCFVVLSYKNGDFVVLEDEKKIIVEPNIAQKLSEQFAGRDLILFTEPFEIIKRLDDACNEKKLNRLRGIVQYYDDEAEVHPLSREDFDKSPYKSLLYKRKFFDFQREYRIVIKKKFDSDLTLNIGDIRDITLNLGITEPGNLQITIKYTETEEAAKQMEG
jgi:hypothetical protein